MNIWRLISGLDFMAFMRRRGQDFLASRWRFCLALWVWRGVSFCFKPSVYAAPCVLRWLVNEEWVLLFSIMVE
jgi:hypothetical protein